MKRKFYIWSALISIAGVISLLIISSTTMNIVWGEKLRRTMAELKAAGEPGGIDEVKPAVAEEQNAAETLRTIFVRMTSGGGGIPYDKENPGALNSTVSRLLQASDRAAFSALDRQSREKLRGLLREKEMTEIFALVRTAASFGAVDFGVDYSGGPGPFLPHLTMEKELARLICAKALLEADGGKPDDAYSTILDGLKISNQLASEPLLISHLLRIACDRMLIACLMHIEQKHGIPQARAAEFVSELKRHQYYDSLPAMFDGERLCFGKGFYESALSGKSHARNGFSRSIFLKNDYATYIAKAAEMKKLSKETFQELRESGKLKEVQNSIKNLPDYCGARAFLNSMLAAFGYTATGESIKSYCTTSLALEIHREKHGAYPETLEALVPETLDSLPVDCFTGKPFIYSRAGKDCSLKSADPEFQKTLENDSLGKDGDAGQNNLLAGIL